MVALVDQVLREELHLADGLAAPNVYVLDPCCGTGSHLIEVLNRIAETLREKGGDALTAQEVKRAAMERVFGFEIPPAPFIVTHLQIGLLLQSLERSAQADRQFLDPGDEVRAHPADRAVGCGVRITAQELAEEDP
jgi:predicted helicase